MTEKRYRLKPKPWAEIKYIGFSPGYAYAGDFSPSENYLTAKECAERHPADWEVVEVNPTSLPTDKQESV